MMGAWIDPSGWGLMSLMRALNGTYPSHSLPDTISVDFYAIERRKRRHLLIIDRIERLDTELKSLGIRPIQSIWRD